MRASAWVRMRRRFLKFHSQRIARCRVFIIPCATNHNAVGGSGPVLELTRPLFRIKHVQWLQRLADAYPVPYIASLVCLSTVPTFLAGRETPVFTVINTVSLLLGIVFFSSKRHNIDSVAAMHLVSCFRFLYCAVLCVDVRAVDTAGSSRCKGHDLLDCRQSSGDGPHIFAVFVS